jgi:Zn-dependent protease
METFIYRMAVGLPGFLLAIVFHEWAHAYVAHRFGDDTAKHSGRLSLNPVVHFDLVGSILFPLLGAALGGVMFGWAKPVPVDPRKFKNIKSAIFWVSFAGPGANIILMIVSAMLLAFVAVKVSPTFYFYDVLVPMLQQSVMINIVLAVFNLIPFPPLDGSKMVSTFLDYETARKYEGLQRYSFVFLLLLWFTPVLQYLMTPAVMVGNQVSMMFIRMFT